MQALIVLCGGLVKTKTGWRTTTFTDDGDDAGLLGDYLRIHAAAYLYKDNPNIKIIMSGGKGHLQHDESAPEMAPIMKAEAIALGVAEDAILIDITTNSTFQQLQALSTYGSEYGFTSFGIISNEYHLPRIQAMLEHVLPQIRSSVTVEYISAEKICLEHDAKQWGKVIEAAYATKAMQERIHLEHKGISDIKSGNYKLV